MPYDFTHMWNLRNKTMNNNNNKNKLIGTKVRLVVGRREDG